MEPGEANSLIGFNSLDLTTNCGHPANYLMAGGDPRTADAQLTFNDMKIGAADSASRNAHQDFIVCQLGCGEIDKFKRPAVDRSRCG